MQDVSRGTPEFCEMLPLGRTTNCFTWNNEKNTDTVEVVPRGTTAKGCGLPHVGSKCWRAHRPSNGQLGDDCSTWNTPRENCPRDICNPDLELALEYVPRGTTCFRPETLRAG